MGVILIAAKWRERTSNGGTFEIFFTSRPRIRGYFNFDSRAHRELLPSETVVSHLCAAKVRWTRSSTFARWLRIFQPLRVGGRRRFFISKTIKIKRKKKEKNNAGTRRCTWSNTLNAYKHFVETINVGNILFFRRKSRGAQ